MVTWTHKPMILTLLVCQHCSEMRRISKSHGHSPGGLVGVVQLPWPTLAPAAPALPCGSIYSAAVHLFCLDVRLPAEGRAGQDKVLLFFDSQSLSHSLAFSRCSIKVE